MNSTIGWIAVLATCVVVAAGCGKSDKASTVPAVQQPVAPPKPVKLKRLERELELKPLERAPLDAKIYNKIPDDLQTMLEKAEQFELLSISPYPPKEKTADAFHGWEVLGKTTVKDAEVRKKLVAAFKKGVEANAGITADCFSPRHGIRVTHDGKTADFVICFECMQVKVFVGDKQEKGFLITDSPQAGFDSVLKEAKVTLPKQPKE